jgi:hypothetical protein
MHVCVSGCAHKTEQMHTHIYSDNGSSKGRIFTVKRFKGQPTHLSFFLSTSEWKGVLSYEMHNRHKQQGSA